MGDWRSLASALP